MSYINKTNLITILSSFLSLCYADQGTTILKTCDQPSQIEYFNGEHNLHVQSKDKCIDSKKINWLSTKMGKDEFSKKIREKLNQAEARNKRALASVEPEFLETALNMAGDKGNDNSLASVDPKKVTFLCTLALNVYYEKAASLNRNNISFEYLDKKIEYEGDLRKIKQRLDLVEKFIETIKKQLHDKDLIALLEEKKASSDIQGLEKGEGTQINITQKEEDKTKLKNIKGNIKTVKENAQKIKVSNLHNQALNSIVEQFKRTFKDSKIHSKSLDAISLEELMDALTDINTDLLKKQTRLIAKLQTFSDPFLKEYWAKLKKVLLNDAKGFEPIDVFYRNLEPYKEPISILKNVSQAKHNAEIDDAINDQKIYSQKQFSGVLLFKDGIKENKDEDEAILVFSGSNSEEDWKHNLNFFKKHGESDTGLGLGLRMHAGIHDALEDSLKEAGTKIAYWIDDYRERLKNVEKSDKKRKLKIITTGHSLGGGLSLLAAVHLKQTIAEALKDVADVSIEVVNFAAPPIFNKKSAEIVEKMLGKKNIVRVWTIGDPVTHLSVLHKDDSRFKQSPLAALIGLYHVGQSIPLFDDLGLQDFIDQLNPWKKHSSSWYANLVHLHEGRWKEHSLEIMGKINREIKSDKIGNFQKLADELNKIMIFLRDPSKSLLTIDLPLTSLNHILHEKAKPTQNILADSRKVQKEEDKKGSGGKVVLKKQPLNSEKTLSYKHEFEGGESVPVTLTRSTTCNADSLLKNKGKHLRHEEKAELSCGCCWAKNLFVSHDNSIISKIQRVRGKKIDTLETIENFCKKHCNAVESRLFPHNQKLLKSTQEFMANLTTNQGLTLAEKLNNLEIEVK